MAEHVAPLDLAVVWAPNEGAVAGHRLPRRGLEAILWAGTVLDSELVRSLQVLSTSTTAGRRLVHHVVLLKECAVEVVAEDLVDDRHADPTTLLSASRTEPAEHLLP